MISSLDNGFEGVDILLDDEMVGTNRARRSRGLVQCLIPLRLANKPLIAVCGDDDTSVITRLRHNP